MRAKVLSVGYDPYLLSLRNAVLARGSHAVTQARTLAQAKTYLAGQEFDVVVLGHSLPPLDMDELISSARAKSKIKVLVVFDSERESHPKADLTISTLDGPNALLKAIDVLLERGS